MGDEPREPSGEIISFMRLWGIAESMLDHRISEIFRDHDGRAIDDQTPVTLERKLNFLKKSFTDIPALAPFQGHAFAIVSGFSAEKDLRNTIVHAAPIKIERNGAVHFVRVRPNFENPAYELRIVRPKDWARLQTVCTTLLVDLMILGSALNPGSPVLHQTQDEFREWLMEGAASFPASKRIRNLLQEIVSGVPHKDRGRPTLRSLIHRLASTLSRI
jgi:hypothetical protein